LNTFQRNIRRVIILSAILVLLIACSFFSGPQLLASGLKKNDKPNIILIYADDLGYSDPSCYGVKYGNTFIETPNLDRLASEGMIFTNAYAAAPICSPSRAALLTGKSPARLGFEFVTKYEGDTFAWDDESWIRKFEGKKLICPPYTTTLPLEENTVAEKLKAYGYVTAMVGKWHVAPHHKKYLGWSLSHGPGQQGFNWAAESFGAHTYGYTEKDKDMVYPSGEYPEDELTNKAIEYIGMEHQEPFFLFVSHYFVHTPIDNRLDWLINKYREKSLQENEAFPEKLIRYAAFVDRLDHYIGQILDAVDKRGLAKNTLVVFTSDNGGHPSFAFNRPFRGSKWNLYEGGIRVPLIIRWPEVVENGTECDVPVIQMDLLPTFIKICGQQNHLDDKLDGISILPLFKGEEIQEAEDRPLVWHFPYYHPEGGAYDEARDEIGIEDKEVSKTKPQSAIRKGCYKLIYFYESNDFELYDLKEDVQESNDLSQSHPGVAEELESELFNYLLKVKARCPRKNIDGRQDITKTRFYNK
jgi:uncharacterized sulfatase